MRGFRIRMHPRHPRDPCAIVVHLWFIRVHLRLRISFSVAHIFQTPPSHAKNPRQLLSLNHTPSPLTDPRAHLLQRSNKAHTRKSRETPSGKDIHVKTFHSFCAELIKDHAEKCKVSGDFKIFEEMDSAIFIFRELGKDARTASLYANTIGKAKDLKIDLLTNIAASITYI